MNKIYCNNDLQNFLGFFPQEVLVFTLNKKTYFNVPIKSRLK